jgi:hypothetical protein
MSESWWNGFWFGARCGIGAGLLTAALVMWALWRKRPDHEVYGRGFVAGRRLEQDAAKRLAEKTR